MKKEKILSTSMGIVVVLHILLGCSGFFTIPIGKILENPRDYAGKTVTVSGEVTEVFSFLVVRYFIIKDKTGEIPVVTERPLPRRGNKITVKGLVQEAFSIGDKQLIVMVEKKEEKKEP